MATLKSGLSRSSSTPQDLASQIEESLKCLDQELEDLEVSTEGIATKLAALEENCSTIRAHISNLRKVASRLGTNSVKPSLTGLSNFAQATAGVGLGIQPAGHWFGAEVQQVEPAPWQQDPE